MKQNPRARQSGFTRLAAVNPVPSSEHGGLAARLSEIKPQLPHVDPPVPRSRWKPPIIALAAVFVLGVGGVAVAASWGPLSAIGAADRSAEPTDTLSPAAKEQVRKHEISPDGVIGTRLVDEARLLGELPDGRKVHVVPTSKSNLCIVVAEGGGSCYEPLSRAEPITFTVSKAGPGAPHVIWGAATDDVISVSFELGGHPVTVPVEGNFYAWEGQASETMKGVSPVTVTFSDGTTQQAP
ncbi:MAG TPA: hypothetical protein VJZ25_01545 [Gemmatimonadaceae bacterium]|nr:hypothetical protein [Gemmatimonadaceae bacterium]